MGNLVLDSNSLLASVLLDEPLTQQAIIALRSWRNARTGLAAPRLFRCELVAVVRKAVCQKRITHEQGKAFLQILIDYSVEFYDDDALMVSAFDLVARFNLPRAYDAQYLALAERLECEFWTADERLYNTVQAQFRWIKWLGSYLPEFRGLQGW